MTAYLNNEQDVGRVYWTNWLTITRPRVEILDKSNMLF